jgi:hypothetical protein
MSTKLHKVTNKELLFRFIENKPMPYHRVTYSEMQKFLFELNRPGETFDKYINRGYQSTNLVPGSGYMYKDAGYGKLVKLVNDYGKATYTVVRPHRYKETYKFKNENKINVMSTNKKFIKLFNKKFKVGDTVIGNSKANDKYEVTVENWLGAIININSDGYIQIKGTNGGQFWVDPICFDLVPKRNKAQEASIKEHYEVDVPFIKAAHSAACSEWKKKLEAKFPGVFPKLTPIELALKKFGRDTVSDGFKKVIVYDNYIFIPLPNANNAWTMSAFEFAKEFIKQNPNSYIVHNAVSPFESLKKSDKFDESSNEKELYNYLVINFNE